MALSIKGLFATLSIKDRQHNNTTIILSVFMLSVAFYCHAECRYAECHYAKCHLVECRGAAENQCQLFLNNIIVNTN